MWENPGPVRVDKRSTRYHQNINSKVKSNAQCHRNRGDFDVPVVGLLCLWHRSCEDAGLISRIFDRQAF